MAAEPQQELETLSGHLAALGIDQAKFDSLYLKLGPQESRLFSRLLDGPADTVTIRNRCAIGNISEVRATLNAKLSAAGDPRRIVCNMVPHTNQFGQRGELGEWRLVNAQSANEATA